VQLWPFPAALLLLAQLIAYGAPWLARYVKCETFRRNANSQRVHPTHLRTRAMLGSAFGCIGERDLKIVKVAWSRPVNAHLRRVAPVPEGSQGHGMATSLQLVPVPAEAGRAHIQQLACAVTACAEVVARDRNDPGDRGAHHRSCQMPQ